MEALLETCLFPECPKKRDSRGLCHAHYGVARVLVKRGTCSWESLEAAGKSLPISKGGSRPGKSQRWFMGEAFPEIDAPIDGPF